MVIGQFLQADLGRSSNRITLKVVAHRLQHLSGGLLDFQTVIFCFFHLLFQLLYPLPGLSRHLINTSDLFPETIHLMVMCLRVLIHAVP